MGFGWQAVVVGTLAGVVGLGELVSRFRSDPMWVLRRSTAAWVYIAINATAGVAALFLIRAFGWFDTTSNPTVWRILVASFGAIGFFRSSLFQAKIGNSIVGVGPSVVLGQILEACDRQIDRKSAEEISKIISGDRLDKLDPKQVMYALPVLCLALMQNFPPNDQAQMATELDKIRADTNLGTKAQVRALVIQLAKYLSSDLIETVLKNANAALERGPAPAVTLESLSGDAVLEAAMKIMPPPPPPATA